MDMTTDALASAAIGMRAQSKRLDAIAGDLANAATPGYRARSFDCTSGAAVQKEQQGALRRTGGRTDLALVGRGYFAIATADGVAYTRDGRFSAGGDCSLVDVRGNHVLGALGPIRFPRGAHIEPDGRVIDGGRVIDRLRVVALSTDELCDAGAYLKASASALPRRASATVHAGYLEESTVNPLVEMTDLVAAQRAYEADQKAAQRADETLRRAVTDVPAVRS